MLNIAITNAELQDFIEAKVRSGEYPSVDEVVAAGVSLLRQDPDSLAPPEEIDELRMQIALGIGQATRGEYSQFTAEDVIAEGMKKLQGRCGTS